MRREQAMQQQADVVCAGSGIKILFGKVQQAEFCDGFGVMRQTVHDALLGIHAVKKRGFNGLAVFTHIPVRNPALLFAPIRRRSGVSIQGTEVNTPTNTPNQNRTPWNLLRLSAQQKTREAYAVAGFCKLLELIGT